MGRLGATWSVEVERIRSAIRRRLGFDAGRFVVARGQRFDDTLIPVGLAPFGYDRARRDGSATLDSFAERGRVDAFRRRAQQFRFVTDDDDSDLTANERFRRLVRVGACGTPVIAGDDLVLPSRLSTATPASGDDFADPETHARIAFRQWSAVFDELVLPSMWEKVGRPAVSIVISTRRPSFARLWASQVSRQTYRNVQVVCALHGYEFTDGHRSEIRSILDGSGVVVQFVEVDAATSLGHALNTAWWIADGDVILKWDDDDLYSSNHVMDLLRARHYSQAPLVGKACDFLYLAGRDVLVRRHQADREVYSPTLSGNTLMIDRDALDTVGGWADVSVGEDASLIARVRREGGQTYRTMGFGMIAVRQASSDRHTWHLDEESLISGAVRTWPGLAVDRALVDVDESLIDEVRRLAGGGR
jgi:hypothetical protein